MISPDVGAAELMDTVAAAFPDLGGRPFHILGAGWDSVALEVDGRLVFKFPRHEAARAALIREASLLAEIRPRVTLAVPDIELVQSPRLFSRHQKIPGEHLFSEHYLRMNRARRADLARTLAQFLAETHALDPALMETAGGRPIKPWLEPEAILAGLETLPPDSPRDWALRTFEAWQALPPDPYGLIYGHFDGHGWNMAFDHARVRLNGIYDFADSGFGPLHQDFIYSSWISFHLTDRIVDAYEDLTGRSLDRRRITLTAIVLRITEFVELSRAHGTPELGRIVELANLAAEFPTL
ncbi:Phosphotransferase enzyme family protein [Kaistia soli DSM 19436]|uniref:Phosphotransferase enzyme family protein n=1 Tax=Kaistia soli DSM 19436 TaxID=1122133 RepID=A0A1M4WUP5_9HYPH|nr:aminoglycoside phosphotransferase family protein [Kaistia soli]SHE84918.1 Phosphotransferase enzyme family protein [Kaistia soli DSM 19436]